MWVRVCLWKIEYPHIKYSVYYAPQQDKNNVSTRSSTTIVWRINIKLSVAWWCLHTTHTHTHKKQTHTITHLRLTHNNSNKNNIRELSSSLPSPFSSRSRDRDSRLLCLLHFCEKTKRKSEIQQKIKSKNQKQKLILLHRKIGGFFKCWRLTRIASLFLCYAKFQ